MLDGKVPAMATVNGLYLAPYEKEFQLTELENNLIARIINFQYIFCLKKSRWAATKKQMITVPVTQDTLQNTLRQMRRLPREASIIEVGIKRKISSTTENLLVHNHLSFINMLPQLRLMYSCGTF